MLERHPGMCRRIALALVFIALGLMVLRPVCDATLATAGHDATGQVCCAVADDGTLADSPAPIGSGKLDAGGPGAALGGMLLFLSVSFFGARLRAGPGLYPPQRSYYVRSARVRR
jgi:hypothetical protein